MRGPVTGRLLLRAALTVLAAGSVGGYLSRAGTQATPSAAAAPFDEAGVRAVVSKRIDGIRTLDAHLSAEPFADDAVWINAFGRRIVGREAIEDWLTRLYASPNFARRDILEPSRIAEVVFRRPDVAVARVYTRHGNQRQSDGTTIVERRSHNTMTLTREPSGWKIRYEIVTDERDGPRRP